MVITKSDYDSGRLSPLDREAYELGLSEKPNGKYSAAKLKPFSFVRNYSVGPGPRRDFVYTDTSWCDASERISKREQGVDWRGWNRRKSRR